MAPLTRGNKEANVTIGKPVIRGILFSSFFAATAGFSYAGGAFIERFDTDLGASGWRVSEYTHPGEWLDTRWAARQVDRRDGEGLFLHLSPDFRSQKLFAGGEIRRRARTHYGRYEAILTAAKGSGLNTAFFTYTGPHLKTPKDEIDFEILGKDTTKVDLNAFVSGEKLQGQFAELGFDAADGPHLYAFEWTEEAIRWYADGRLLYEILAKDAKLPTTPGQVYLSLWAGHPKIKGWLGFASPDTEATAQFQCVSFVPIGGTGPQCSDE